MTSRPRDPAPDVELAFAEPVFADASEHPAAAPPEDVHNVRTAVAELPPGFLESLKASCRSTAAELEALVESPALAIPDLSGHLDDDDELETLELDGQTITIDVVSTLPPPPRDPAPETIELHVVTRPSSTGALAAVESEIAHLPRTWMLAGAFAASLVIAVTTAALLWALAHP